MNTPDIVTTPNVEGYRITAYLGLVFARENTAESVFASVLQQAEALGANKVVGFRLDWQSPLRFYGVGTAVIVAPV